MKDWRGTEIEVDARVLTHSANKGYGVGVVTQLHKNTVAVHLTESNYWSPGPPKNTLVTLPSSLTVLTEDLFPELAERVAALEGDIEYYKSEVSRTW